MLTETLKLEWDSQVKMLKQKLILEDQIDLPIHLIAGVDISFDKLSPDKACAAVVVLDFNTLQVVYSIVKHVEMTVPYVPGCLAFREVEHFVMLLEELKTTKYYPQLVFVDGNGIHHPQRFGVACHLGVRLNIPTIGVAKNFLIVDELDPVLIKKEFINNCTKKGQSYPIQGVDGKQIGAAVATIDGLCKPIFVSPGHRVSTTTAIELTLKCCKGYRQPEPIRQADHVSKITFF